MCRIEGRGRWCCCAVVSPFAVALLCIQFYVAPVFTNSGAQENARKNICVRHPLWCSVCFIFAALRHVRVQAPVGVDGGAFWWYCSFPVQAFCVAVGGWRCPSSLWRRHVCFSRGGCLLDIRVLVVQYFSMYICNPYHVGVQPEQAKHGKEKGAVGPT